MPSKKIPTIAALLTNYNHGHYLPETFEIIKNQTVPFDEIIIIDDCSTDNSIEIIKSLLSTMPNARLLQNNINLGVNESLNRGLKEVKSDFIFFMSADDMYSAAVVEWAKKALEKYPDIAMVSGNSRIFYESSKKEKAFTLPFTQQMAVYSHEDIDRVAQKRNFTFFGGANVIRRDTVISLGGFLEPMRWHSDWFLYLAIGFSNKFAFIPHEFVYFRLTESQYSRGCYDWSKQKHVIESIVKIMRSNYPDLYVHFRKNALLPLYQHQSLWLLLKNPDLRHYLTPLLAWRLLTYEPLRKMQNCIPNNVRHSIRKLLKV